MAHKTLALTNYVGAVIGKDLFGGMGSLFDDGFEKLDLKVRWLFR